MLSNAKKERLRRMPLDGAVNRVRKARELAELTQVEMGERIGMFQSSITRIERGDYSDLPLETTRRLAVFFGVPIEVLFPALDKVTA